MGSHLRPNWFPGEQKVVFTNKQSASDIYAIDISGNILINLTNHPANDEAGVISPDGKYLLFSSDREGNNNQELYLMNIETKKLENITQTPEWELIGRWSADGQRVYFGSNKDGNWELYVYDLQTRETLRLTTSEGFDGDPRVLTGIARIYTD